MASLSTCHLAILLNLPSDSDVLPRRTNSSTCYSDMKVGASETLERVKFREQVLSAVSLERGYLCRIF